MNVQMYEVRIEYAGWYRTVNADTATATSSRCHCVGEGAIGCHRLSEPFSKRTDTLAGSSHDIVVTRRENLNEI